MSGNAVELDYVVPLSNGGRVRLEIRLPSVTELTVDEHQMLLDMTDKVREFIKDILEKP